MVSRTAVNNPFSQQNISDCNDDGKLRTQGLASTTLIYTKPSTEPSVQIITLDSPDLPDPVIPESSKDPDPVTPKKQIKRPNILRSRKTPRK